MIAEITNAKNGYHRIEIDGHQTHTQTYGRARKVLELVERYTAPDRPTSTDAAIEVGLNPNTGKGHLRNLGVLRSRSGSRSIFEAKKRGVCETVKMEARRLCREDTTMSVDDLQAHFPQYDRSAIYKWVADIFQTRTRANRAWKMRRAKEVIAAGGTNADIGRAIGISRQGGAHWRGVVEGL